MNTARRRLVAAVVALALVGAIAVHAATSQSTTPAPVYLTFDGAHCLLVALPLSIDSAAAAHLALHVTGTGSGATPFPVQQAPAVRSAAQLPYYIRQGVGYSDGGPQSFQPGAVVFGGAICPVNLPNPSVPSEWSWPAGQEPPPFTGAPNTASAWYAIVYSPTAQSVTVGVVR